MKLPFGLGLPRDLGELRGATLRWGTLSWAALPVTDRRWSAPLAGCALAMGLIVGVALGPGAAVGVGGPVQLIVQAIPEIGDEGEPAPGGALESSAPVLAGPLGNTVAAGGGTPPPPPPPAPVAASTPAPAPAPPARAPSPKVEPDVPIDGGGEETRTLSGTVVQLNPAAESYTFATDEGEMVAIHSRKLPEPQAALQVGVRPLFNGTLAEDGKPAAFGENTQADVAGVVTFRDPFAGVYTVSGTGSSILVERPAGASPDSLPPLGAGVSLTAAIEPLSRAERVRTRRLDPPPAPSTATPTEPPGPARPECGTPEEPPPTPAAKLVEVELAVDEPDTGASEAAGIVQGVCEQTGELILSADAIRQSQTDIALEAGGFELGELAPGDVLNVSLAITEAGAYELLGLASDDGAKEADDPALAQGDQAEGAED